MRSKGTASAFHSVADVIDHVRKVSEVSEDFEINFSASSCIPPGRRRTGFLVASIRSAIDSSETRIELPTCSDFSGSTMDSTKFLPSWIAYFHGAVATSDGIVRIQPSEAWPSGAELRNVQFHAVPLDCSVSEIEHFIVFLAIKFIRAEQSCYREIAPDHLPGMRRLDYAAIAKVKIDKWKPLLNSVEDELARVMKGNPTVEMRKEYRQWAGKNRRRAIEQTLKKSGLKMPRSK